MISDNSILCAQNADKHRVKDNRGVVFHIHNFDEGQVITVVRVYLHTHVHILIHHTIICRYGCTYIEYTGTGKIRF